MIIDIPGVCCPMGCGNSLHVTDTGITCLEPGCADPRAAHKILAETETSDIVDFREGDFTVLHPLRERLGDLFDCPVNRAVAGLDGPPEGRLGRYRARIAVPGGHLELERLEGHPESEPVNLRVQGAIQRYIGITPKTGAVTPRRCRPAREPARPRWRALSFPRKV